MSLIDSINKSITDQEITYMILILTIAFGFIPLLTAIKKEQKKREKVNGKYKEVTKTQLTKNGVWYLALAFLIGLVGYWKLKRDNASLNTQLALNGVIRNISNESDKTERSMAKALDYDSTLIVRLNTVRAECSLRINKNLQIYSKTTVNEPPMIYMGKGSHDISITGGIWQQKNK